MTAELRPVTDPAADVATWFERPSEEAPRTEPEPIWSDPPPEPARFRNVASPQPIYVDRETPHDLGAERAVLGSILIDRGAIGEVSDSLTPVDFYRQAHGRIYAAMLAIDGRGEPLDVVTVVAELERAGVLEGVGGASYLSTLGNDTPTAIHVEQYGRLVADRARERATIMAAGRIAEAAYGRAPDLAERVSEIVAGLPRAASVGNPIGDLTALDLPLGPAPDQLAGPFLTPEGPTVIYARGGTGKGLLTCRLVVQLVRSGRVVMVLDYEGHRREWSFRLRGLGLSDDELRRVRYRAPFGPEWTAQTGALSVVADLVREDAERCGVDYLIVDSYSVATSNGDTMGGEQAAREYFGALARIGLPSLTIAHVRGDSGQFPDRPFGSVFVHNLARETWAIERVGIAQVESREAFPYEPAVVALEIRNKKANGRSMSPAQFVTFTFYADGTIEAACDQPTARPIADLAADALADEPMALAKIVAAIKEDTGRAVSEDTLRTILTRESGRFVQAAGKRPRAWSLR